MVGRDLVKGLLAASNKRIVLLVHERAKNMPLGEVLEFLGIPTTEANVSRVECVEGDITKPNLGLNGSKLEELRLHVKAIIHAAGDTNFNREWKDIERVNVLGTERVVDFAKSCSSLEQLLHLSTAYVSGLRTGLIKEEELEHSSGFVNTYERSKYQAEQIVRSSGLPIKICRLSTVMGDSRTGRVEHFIAPHQALRLIYLGLASMLPGEEDYKVDLIPSDYAVRALLAAFKDPEAIGKTFHIASIPEKSYSLSEIIDKTYDIFARLDPEWKSRNYPKPAIVEPETFDNFIEAVEQTGSEIVSRMLSIVKSFSGQLSAPKVFDQTNLENVLNSPVESLPHIDDYYEKIVYYCLKTRWGRL